MLTRWLGTALLALGACMLLTSAGYVALVTVSRYQASTFQPEELAADQRMAPSPQLAPGGGDASVSSTPQRDLRSFPAPTHIWIPTIDVDSGITPIGIVANAQGELVWETPKNTVGHPVGTANPGVPGNVVLAGHVSSPIRHEGNVFNRLADVKLGDLVKVQTDDGLYTYQVVSRKVVEPTEVSVMDPTPTPVITLITCYPDLIYTHRLILRGEPVAFEPAAQ